MSWTFRCLLVLLTLAGASGCHCDDLPGRDYAHMQRRAEIDGSVEVIARGIVEEVRAPKLFVLENDELFSQRLWVLSTSQLPIACGDRLLARGEMRRIDPWEIERDYVIELPADLERELSEEAILVAPSLTAFVTGTP